MHLADQSRISLGGELRPNSYQRVDGCERTVDFEYPDRGTIVHLPFPFAATDSGALVRVAVFR